LDSNQRGRFDGDLNQSLGNNYQNNQNNQFMVRSFRLTIAHDFSIRIHSHRTLKRKPFARSGSRTHAHSRTRSHTHNCIRLFRLAIVLNSRTNVD
jgi:hypothetical protein